MNKHILFVMRNLDNPELFTQEEKEGNKKSATTDWASADAAWAADAATDWTATDWASANAAWAADAAVYMAYAAYAAYAATDWTATEWWVNKFFERAGEDKQTYIDEVERLKEDKIMTIENQIAVHCDEANEISACELLSILIGVVKKTDILTPTGVRTGVLYTAVKKKIIK